MGNAVSDPSDMEQQLTQARKRRAEGASLRTIARELGLPHSTLADRLKPRPKKAKKKKGPKLVRFLKRETPQARLTREVREAQEHPTARDSGLLSTRAAQVAWYALRRLEARIRGIEIDDDGLSTRDLVGAFKILSEQARWAPPGQQAPILQPYEERSERELDRDLNDRITELSELMSREEMVAAGIWEPEEGDVLANPSSPLSKLSN